MQAPGTARSDLQTLLVPVHTRARQFRLAVQRRRAVRRFHCIVSGDAPGTRARIAAGPPDLARTPPRTPAVPQGSARRQGNQCPGTAELLAALSCGLTPAISGGAQSARRLME